MQIKFYESVDPDLLKFAVIIARHNGKWILCKHKNRTTLEIPGGHREPGEDIDFTARRELWEETGATDFELSPVCVYSVTAPDNFDGKETFGMLYFAEVKAFETELHSEIEKTVLVSTLPKDNWTYPLIQPKLLAEYFRRTGTNNE